MSEHMQPIDPVTAAMLMGQVPDPCEPIIEISRKVLTKLLDVVEFGDQLERVEKDRLLAHLKDVLAEEHPELWAMHSPGPGEVHPMISKEEADRQASELLALFKERFPETPITVNVIPSPFSPLEHFEILAEELSEQVTDLREALEKQPSGSALPEHYADGQVNIDRTLFNEIRISEPVSEVGEPTKYIITEQQLQRIAELEFASAGTTTVAMPTGLHPDTQDLVTRFATALAVKLHAAELKHGYSNGWKEPHWMDECRQKLIEHLAKGGPRDVAAYCAFLWHHCQSTSPKACNHEWTDDGLHLLVCTSCGAQEDHNPGWRDMATAPRDGTMLRLLVDFSEHATEDADEAPTIGSNSFDNDGEDRWQFAGWCWSHDRFVEGKGEPIGWLPMLDEPCCIAPEQLEQQP